MKNMIFDSVSSHIGNPQSSILLCSESLVMKYLFIKLTCHYIIVFHYITDLLQLSAHDLLPDTAASLWVDLVWTDSICPTGALLLGNS